MEKGRLVHYSARCRNCTYSRHFGFAMITAETKATVHALKKGHTVDITAIDMETLISRVYLTVPNQDQMVTLAQSEQEPPY